MLMTVIVPTYRRVQDLARCLTALQQQTRSPDEVLVIVRDLDTATWSFLEEFFLDDLPLKAVKISVPGQVAALNAGLEAARGEIIAITDDDAAPHPSWLARIEQHFLGDTRVGGVGGRDWVYVGQKREEGVRSLVGKVHWCGRVTGNHHLGAGEAREVDLLKGANMSFRRSAIASLRFDQRLRGTGAQVDNDMAFCLALKRKGWKLIYDPAVMVDHYPAQRFDEHQRGQFNRVALLNAVHNETLALLSYLSPPQRVAFLLWSIAIGTRKAFGGLQCLRFLPTEGSLAAQKWLVSLQGRWQGWQSWQASLPSCDRPHLVKND